MTGLLCGYHDPGGIFTRDIYEVGKQFIFKNELLETMLAICKAIVPEELLK